MSNASSHARHNDCRQWLRFPSDECIVVVGPSGVRWKGALLEESFGGASCRFEKSEFASEALQSGAQVTVHYRGAPMTALVRHASWDEFGAQTVGLQFQGPGTGSESS